MLNKVMLIGNLGRDPELKALPSGGDVLNASIATTARWKDKQGEVQERTEWHNLVIFGASAANFSRFMRKGMRVYVEGRLQTRSWEDRDSGKKQYRTEIVVESWRSLSSLKDTDHRDESAPAAADDNEIPF